MFPGKKKKNLSGKAPSPNPPKKNAACDSLQLNQPGPTQQDCLCQPGARTASAWKAGLGLDHGRVDFCPFILPLSELLLLLLKYCVIALPDLLVGQRVLGSIKIFQTTAAHHII